MAASVSKGSFRYGQGSTTLSESRSRKRHRRENGPYKEPTVKKFRGKENMPPPSLISLINGSLQRSLSGRSGHDDRLPPGPSDSGPTYPITDRNAVVTTGTWGRTNIVVELPLRRDSRPGGMRAMLSPTLNMEDVHGDDGTFRRRWETHGEEESEQGQGEEKREDEAEERRGIEQDNRPRQDGNQPVEGNTQAIATRLSRKFGSALDKQGAITTEEAPLEISSGLEPGDGTPAEEESETEESEMEESETEESGKEESGKEEENAWGKKMGKDKTTTILSATELEDKTGHTGCDLGTAHGGYGGHLQGLLSGLSEASDRHPVGGVQHIPRPGQALSSGGTSDNNEGDDTNIQLSCGVDEGDVESYNENSGYMHDDSLFVNALQTNEPITVAINGQAIRELVMEMGERGWTDRGDLWAKDLAPVSALGKSLFFYQHHLYILCRKIPGAAEFDAQEKYFAHIQPDLKKAFNHISHYVAAICKSLSPSGNTPTDHGNQPRRQDCLADVSAVLIPHLLVILRKAFAAGVDVKKLGHNNVLLAGGSFVAATLQPLIRVAGWIGRLFWALQGSSDLIGPPSKYKQNAEQQRAAALHGERSRLESKLTSLDAELRRALTALGQKARTENRPVAQESNEGASSPSDNVRDRADDAEDRTEAGTRRPARRRGDWTEEENDYIMNLVRKKQADPARMARDLRRKAEEVEKQIVVVKEIGRKYFERYSMVPPLWVD